MTWALSGAGRPNGAATTIASQPGKTEFFEGTTYAQGIDASESATQIQRPSVEDHATLILIEESEASHQLASEATTQIMPAGSTEAATQMQPARVSEKERARVLQHTTVENLARQTIPADGLTRVGSILGTPTYMSPEQCRSESLDARSDIYSLGVIAYQMLAGEPPFTGPAYELMRLHIDAPPPPLKEKRRKMPKRMAAIVMSALAKNPADRPASAAGFASALRATSEGTGALLRRAFALYVEHFPKFFRVTFLLYLPLIGLHTALLISALLRSDTAEAPAHPGDVKIALSTAASGAVETVLSILMFFASFVINTVIVGATIRLVTQIFLSPLRPLQLRTTYAAVRKRLKPLLVTIAIASFRWFLGILLLVIPGVIMFINYSLAAPVVMMEGLKGRAALKRSKALVKRCWRSVIVILCLQWAIPAVATSIVIIPIAAALKLSKIPQAPLLTGRISSIIVVLLNVIIVPLIATLTALLYLKARQIGLETLKEALSQFEEEDTPRTKWQMRMREGLQTTTKP